MAQTTATITMSMREADRLKTVQAVIDRMPRVGQAAQRLGISLRQFERLVQRYRSEGADGLVPQFYAARLATRMMQPACHTTPSVRAPSLGCMYSGGRQVQHLNLGIAIGHKPVHRRGRSASHVDNRGVQRHAGGSDQIRGTARPSAGTSS
ncbi:MAG TPA: helix-turn-helix domain-containing protein [Pseudorhodoferax sp.]|nr:helix-turn-helix domain-containing protein [Pseudorhodoferax sp.]